MVFRHRDLTDFSIEPGEFPKKNTSPVLKLFVYGTLKHGYPNHDAFCRGVREMQEAQARGPPLRGARVPAPRSPRRGHPGLPDRPTIWPTWPHRRACPTGWGQDSRPVPERELYTLPCGHGFVVEG